MARPELPEPRRLDALQRIERSTKVMGQLISDLLEYTGTQLGRSLPVRRAHCNMGALCEEVLERVKSIYPKQEFALTLDGDLNLQADPMRMQQVLSNLLNNAVNHGKGDRPAG